MLNSCYDDVILQNFNNLQRGVFKVAVNKQETCQDRLQNTAIQTVH